MQQSTEQIKADLHEQTGELKAHGQQVAAGIRADVAQQSRILLRAVSAELPDCPRLFTLVPRQAGGWQRVKLWQDSFRITLWCEHPGAEHPWPAAQYDFGRPKQWLATVAPYVVVVSRLLQALVPVGERRSASPCPSRS